MVYVCFDCGELTEDYGFRDEEYGQVICASCVVKNNLREY